MTIDSLRISLTQILNNLPYPCAFKISREEGIIVVKVYLVGDHAWSAERGKLKAEMCKAIYPLFDGLKGLTTCSLWSGDGICISLPPDETLRAA